MANENPESKNYTNYVSLNNVIGNAIVAFDNIHDALAGKSVPNYTAGAQGRPVSEYHTAITNYLFRVEGRDLSYVGLNVIPDKSGNDANKASTLTADSVTYGGSNAVTLQADGLDKAYYDNQSIVKITMTGTPVSVSGNLNTAGSGYTLDNGIYEYSLDGKIVSSLSVTKAVVSATTGTLVGTDLAINNTDLSLTPQSGLTSGNFKNGTSYDALPSAEKDDYYSVGVGSSLTTSGTITTAIYGSVTAGYISAASEIAVTDTTTPIGANGLALSGTLNDSIYIKKSTITVGEPTGGVLTMTGDGIGIEADNLPTGAQLSDYYAIAANVTAGTFNATATEGYVVPDANNAISASIGQKSQTLYVKKGSVTAQTKALNITATPSAGIQSTGGVEYNNTDAVSIQINVADMTATTVPISPGYITAEGVDVTYTGGSKELKIRTAGGELVASGVDASLTGTGISLVTADNFASGLTASDYYAISSSISASTLSIDAAASHLGYLDNFNKFSGNINGVAGTTYYVKKGVDQAPTLTYSSQVVDNALVYTITASHTTPAGYYPTDNPTSAAYSPANNNAITVPAAELRWTESNGEGYLEVKTQGYLAAGRTFVFGGGAYEGGESGGESIAAVKATLGNGGQTAVVSSGSTLPSGAYQITIAKSSTTDAGYISGGNKGTLEFADDLVYFVAHGSYAKTLTATTSVGNVTWDATANSNAGSFTVTATPAIDNPNPSTATAGYMTASDISISGKTGSAVVKDLGVGSIGGAVENVTISESTGSTAKTSSTGTYVVNVGVSATVTPSVTAPGYVSPEHSNKTAASVTGTQSIKLQNGSVGSTTLSGTINSEIDETNMKISLTKSNIATVTNYTEGYIKGEGTNGAGSVGLGKDNLILAETSIAAAAVTLQGSGTASLSAEASNAGIKLESAVPSGKTAADFYTLTPSATFGASAATITNGWLKAKTQIESLSNVNASATYYVEKFVGSGSGGNAESGTAQTNYTRKGESTAETVWFYTIGGASSATQDYGQIVIDTKEKYSKRAIVVDLDDNAAGVNVLDDLDKLSSRLAGTLARTSQGS